jgi:hypothetical protein
MEDWGPVVVRFEATLMTDRPARQYSEVKIHIKSKVTARNPAS